MHHPNSTLLPKLRGQKISKFVDYFSSLKLMLLSLMLFFMLLSGTVFSQTGNVTIVLSGGAAEGSGWSYTNGVISPISATAVSVNVADVLAKMASANLSIQGSVITINTDILCPTAGRSLTLSGTKIVQAEGKQVTTQGGDISYTAITPATAVGEASIVFNGAALNRTIINANGGNILINASFQSSGTTGGNDTGIGSYNTDIITSGTGTITLIGDATDATPTFQTYGVWGLRIFDSMIRTNSGDIMLRGKGGKGSGSSTGLIISTFNTSSTKILSNSGRIDLLDEKAIGLIGSQSGSSITAVVGADGNLVTSSTSPIKLISNIPTYSGLTNFNTSGDIIIESEDNSFTYNFSTTTNLSISGNPSSFRFGKSTNTANITIGSAKSIAGPVTLNGGTLALNGAITSTNSNITLNATTSVTQSAAFTANELLLTGAGSATLTNAGNAINTIAGGTSLARIGALNMVNNKALTVGTVSTTAGIYATGLVELATSAGDIQINEPVNSSLSTGDAVKIFADKSVAAGGTTGGNIKIAGNGAVVVASGARALLYSGVESISTGLTTEVGGTANARINVAAATSLASVTPTIGATGKYALYRDIQTLPVVLLSYHAKSAIDGTIELNWLTASELNNSHFEILRSTDGINFTFLGKINGLGNSRQEKRYNFIDQSPLLGTNYYQLVQFDIDGKKKVLGIKSVKVSIVNNLIVYPNPTNGLVNLSFESNSFRKLELIDLTGKIINTRTIGLQESAISFDISDLSSGIYNVRLVGEGTLLTRQIVKQ